MNNNFLTLAFIVIATNSYSQNDTLYLEKEFVLLNEKKFNKIEGVKQVGEWINYGMKALNIIDDNEWLGSGDGFHTQVKYVFEYRALNKDEYYGIRYLISEKIDTIDGELYYDSDYLEIRNKIPSELYYIKGKGAYRNNKKIGKWNYYYQSGRVLKSIIYENGLPVNNFRIFRENGSIMIELIKINQTDWSITKYNEAGIKLDTFTNKTDQFKMLY